MNIRLKIQIVSAGLKNHQLANLASTRLSEEDRLSELAISQIITGRRRPNQRQAGAIEAALNANPGDLFPAAAQEGRT